MLQLVGDCFQFGICLLQTDAWSKPRENLVVRRRALSQRKIVDVDLKGYPNFGDTRKIKTWRHNAEDVVTSAVEIERLTDGVRLPGKTLLPKCVADERHGRPARLIFFS